MSRSWLLDSAVFADPYPVYASLRERGRAIWDDQFLAGSWIVPHYDDVLRLAKMPQMSADRTLAYTMFTDRASDETRALGDQFREYMIFKDPPDHTRLRGLVSRAFTPRAVDQMRTQIANIVDELLEPVTRAGKLEVIRDLAFPLPAIVIAELIGVPQGDRDRIKEWSDALATFFGNITGMKRAAAANLELTAYLAELVAQRRKQPRDDLLSALIRADDELGSLADEELIPNTILLLLAGHHTTMNLIGNGLLALLRHPEQLARLRADPALIPGAIDELLRYDSPVQAVGRVALEDIELGDHTVAAGQRTVLLLGSANRDPHQFEDPDLLDVARNEARHLSFAQGPHYCVGAPLAKVEGEIAFDRLLARFGKLRLADESIRFRENFSLRGLEALHVEAR